MKTSELPLFLNELHKSYNPSLLESDPVYFVHQFKNPKDQEIVAFLSAVLAFGTVKSIHHDLQKIWQVLQSSPYESLLQKTWMERAQQITLGHRWVRHHDLLNLFLLLSDLLKEHGSLKNFFLSHYEEKDLDVGEMLNRAQQSWNKWVKMEMKTRGFSYFFSAPKDGSPCKRLMMFLRWMIRPSDGIDLGLWPEIPTHKLVIPLDTHLSQFALRFKLTQKQTSSWKMAQELTLWLKKIDANDPVKYDFAICHHGMEVGW